MPQKLKCFKPSKHFSLNLANLKAETSLLSALSHLYYLDRHEPLNFAIQYSETRKALGFGIGEFKKIYAAYVKQRGAK
jgi:hypothetical protein